MPDTTDLAALLGRIHLLPALPQALVAVQQALTREQLSVQRCVQLIEHEPALAASTLRLANSAFYGVPGRVSAVGDAVRLLGLRTVASLLTAAALQQLLMALPPDSGDAAFDVVAQWQHAITCAVAARTLAPLCGHDADEALLAGLLHDVGQLAMACTQPELARAARLHALHQGCTALQAEQAVLGLGHTQVGALLARHWRFAPTIVQAIAQHHGAAAPSAGQPVSLASLVQLADRLSHEHIAAPGARAADDAAVASAPPPAAAEPAAWWLALGLSDDQAGRALDAIAAQTQEMSELMLSH